MFQSVNFNNTPKTILKFCYSNTHPAEANSSAVLSTTIVIINPPFFYLEVEKL